MPQIELHEVSAANRQAVLDLTLAPEQEDFVASNAESLKDAERSRSAIPRAIYADGQVVGFIMYSVRRARASIFRFMIDRNHQRKGYGRAALNFTLAEIRSLPGVTTIAIQYMPDNPVAKPFYGSFGFVEVGEDEDGEIIAEMPA